MTSAASDVRRWGIAPTLKNAMVKVSTEVAEKGSPANLAHSARPRLTIAVVSTGWPLRSTSAAAARPSVNEAASDPPATPYPHTST